MRRILTLVFLFFILSSHELFLKSDNYFLEKNKPAELYLLNGTFDNSENIITRDRIIDPKILGPDFSYVPKTEDYYDKENVTFLSFQTGNAGTYVAGISTKARPIELTGEKFTAYLEHEGLTDIILERTQNGISNQPAKEKYSKHVKAILQVGKKKSEHYATPLAYPIEFIPLSNPYALAVGDNIVFQLLYLGEPLGNQTVHVSSRESKEATSGEETALRTNEKGIVDFEVTNSGFWYIATIHMMESEEEAFDYESNWATLTFAVK